MKEWAKGFYTSQAWEETRAAYMLSVDGICERCGEPAKIVHHKKHLTKANIGDASVSLSWDNLEALCQDCHNKEHFSAGQRRYEFAEDGSLTPPISKKGKGGGLPMGVR